MQIIAPKERYIECRLCGNTVGSSQPICRKCGLGISSEGIEELAQIEQQATQATNDVYNLKLVAFIALFFSIIGLYYYFAVDPQAVWFNLPLWIIYIYFIVSFIRWRRKYSEVIFPTNDYEKIREDKRDAFVLIICSAILGFGITILFR